MGSLAAYFLDVGQGDCSLIFPPTEDPVLFDCADAYVAERFLSDAGITRLSAVVVSHLDDDHIGGMLAFLEGFLGGRGRVGTLYLGMDRPPAALGDGVKRHLIDRAVQWARERRLTLAQPLREGAPKVILEGTGWKIRIVLPFYEDTLEVRAADKKAPNRSAAVLRLERAGRSVLIGSDAPLVAWERLEPDLHRTDVFRIPHHGGDIEEGSPTLTRSDLYQRAGASLAVCSVGTRNAYGHPYEAHLLDSRRGGACRLLCTQLNRNCHKKPLDLRDRLLEEGGRIFFPLRHRLPLGDGHRTRRPDQEVPCAGTVLVELDTKGRLEVHPRPGTWHDALVGTMDAPICRRP